MTPAPSWGRAREVAVLADGPWAPRRYWRSELDAMQISIADISGYLMRRYVHGKTGAAMDILLVCGRAGPVSDVRQLDVTAPSCSRSRRAR